MGMKRMGGGIGLAMAAAAMAATVGEMDLPRTSPPSKAKPRKSIRPPVSQITPPRRRLKGYKKSDFDIQALAGAKAQRERRAKRRVLFMVIAPLPSGPGGPTSTRPERRRTEMRARKFEMDAGSATAACKRRRGHV